MPPMTTPLALAAATACAAFAAAAPRPAAAQPIFVEPAPYYAPAYGPVIVAPRYYWGGRRYCWYFDGWRGPGLYWCGYGARYGYGWGGGYGWHGWRHSGGYYHGGRYYGGGHYGGYHG